MHKSSAHRPEGPYQSQWITSRAPPQLKKSAWGPQRLDWASGVQQSTVNGSLGARLPTQEIRLELSRAGVKSWSIINNNQQITLGAHFQLKKSARGPLSSCGIKINSKRTTMAAPPQLKKSDWSSEAGSGFGNAKIISKRITLGAPPNSRSPTGAL